MTTLEVEVTGNLKAYMAGEAAAVVAGARSATKRQTEETKNQARAVVNAGLTGSRQFATGNRRAAQTIRSRYYEDTPAGLVHSTWGYFEGSRFVDILAVHATGATIVPRRGQVPVHPVRRRRAATLQAAARAARQEKVDIIPLPNGQKLVVTASRGQRKGLVLGLLTRRVVIPKRLDFTAVERDAAERAGGEDDRGDRVGASRKCGEARG